jgi:peroxiredoxin
MRRKIWQWAALAALPLMLPLVLPGCTPGGANSEVEAQSDTSQSASTVVGHQSGEALLGPDGKPRYKLDPNLPHAYSKKEVATRRIKIDELAPDFTMPTLDGKTLKLSDFKGKAALLMFADTTCPCVKAYADRMKALDAKFGEFGLRTIYVFSNGKTDTKDTVAKFVKAQDYKWPIVLDLNQKLLKQFDASCSTEVFLFDPKGRLRYHGRIDDDTFEPGAVREHDLQSAIVAVLDGRAVPDAETQAFGCAIPRL